MFLVPGQGFQSFTRLTRETTTTPAGRLWGNGLTEHGQITGMLTKATPKEVDQWKQDGHPVTHKIVQWLTDNRANPQDVLTLPDGDTTRTFLIQGLRDPGEINHCIVYYCEERRDLNGLYHPVDGEADPRN